ncbi:MAG: sugar ABC transporter substrate-binding protein [Planctomycetota bacterium]|nr:MAG: sugar ABC transporter substrate-binding protein [Planctomycetota bacterium]
MICRGRCGAVALLLVVVCLVVGCQEATESKGVIGYSALSMKNPFFTIIAETMAEEAAQHGYTVQVLDSEEDVEKQARQIDSFIQQQVVAIVINPADRVAIGAAVKKANEAGVPLFTNDAQCVAEGVDIAGHAGTDNEQGGRKAGEAMIEVLGETGGEIAILAYPQAHSCVLRVRGFKAVIEAHNAEHPDAQIRIVAENDGGGKQGISRKQTDLFISRNPELAAIFAINDPSALGAYTALEAAGKAGKVTIIGFDGELAGRQAIKEGKIYADPIQFPKKMARVTIENIIKYLDGQEFEKVQLFPTELYRQSDALDDPELK